LKDYRFINVDFSALSVSRTPQKKNLNYFDERESIAGGIMLWDHENIILILVAGTSIPSNRYKSTFQSLDTTDLRGE